MILVSLCVLTLGGALVLQARATGGAVAGMARESAALAKSAAEALSSVRSVMEEEHRFAFGALASLQRDYAQLVSGAAVGVALQKKGLSPYLQDPKSAIQAEIKALQENLGLSLEEAIAYLRSRIKTDAQTMGD
jgi:hypothetical protein